MTADRYAELMRLADLFDGAGAEMRTRAALGEQVLRDPAVEESADLAPTTFAQLDDDVRAATTGRHGLLARSVELDADALVVRATVLTYRWIDDLQEAATRTLGSIAGRAIGYLAPEVALGGAIVTAGLIETDALDRDDVAAYLDELVADNPELLEHAAGGGGLLDGLQLRSLLTVGEIAPAAARAGLRAVGAAPFGADLGAALRDVAAPVVEEPAPARTATGGGGPLAGFEELMTALTTAPAAVSVREVAPQRYVAFLPGTFAGDGRLRLVAGDHTTYADRASSAVAEAVPADARVLLVGCGPGGAAAVELASRPSAYVVDQVVTAGAPAALVPRLPDRVRALALEDRGDPVAQLGSLVNADAPNRLTVVFDGDDYVAGGRAVDATTHPAVRAELDRLRGLGYLA
ncbi:hypothetical protein [Nocardioides aquiterrae]|uniref:Uncharacterized protein n=1 Tax=Nocardioides aquiterrae TaxID=203799 RepID=A0ABN1UGH7_9ACTN